MVGEGLNAVGEQVVRAGDEVLLSHVGEAWSLCEASSVCVFFAVTGDVVGVLEGHLNFSKA